MTQPDISYITLKPHLQLERHDILAVDKYCSRSCRVCIWMIHMILSTQSLYAVIMTVSHDRRVAMIHARKLRQCNNCKVHNVHSQIKPPN